MIELKLVPKKMASDKFTVEIKSKKTELAQVEEQIQSTLKNQEVLQNELPALKENLTESENQLAAARDKQERIYNSKSGKIDSLKRKKHGLGLKIHEL